MTNVKEDLDKLFKENEVTAVYVEKGSNLLVTGKPMSYFIVVNNDLLDNKGMCKKSNAIYLKLKDLYPVGYDQLEDFEQDVSCVDNPRFLCEPVKVYDKVGWLV